MTRYEDVATAIARGDVDDDLLTWVQEVLNARRRLVREQKAAVQSATLMKGDTVVFGDSISPQYLRGLESEIVEQPRAGEKLKVKVLRPELAGRFGHGVITVPADLVEAVDA